MISVDFETDSMKEVFTTFEDSSVPKKVPIVTDGSPVGPSESVVNPGGNFSRKDKLLCD